MSFFFVTHCDFGELILANRFRKHNKPGQSGVDNLEEKIVRFAFPRKEKFIGRHQQVRIHSAGSRNVTRPTTEGL